MFKFFDFIVSCASSIIGFVQSAFEIIAVLITKIPLAISYVMASLVYLPPFLVAYISVFIGIIVVLNIINKGS